MAASSFSTTLADISAVASVVLAAYGSFVAGEAKPIVLAAMFCAAFAFARHRAVAGPARFQLVLVLLLVVFSFGLHLTYLPSGLCCAFALMLCKNDLLLPPSGMKAE